MAWALGAGSWELPGCWLEIQELRPQLRPVNQNLHLTKLPKWHVCSLLLEKHCSEGYYGFYCMLPKWLGPFSGPCCHQCFFTFPLPVLKCAMQCHLPLLLLFSLSAFPTQPWKFLQERDIYTLLYSLGLYSFCLHLVSTWKYLGWVKGIQVITRITSTYWITE